MGLLTMERDKPDSATAARAAAFDQRPKPAALATAPRWRFSVAEYHQMIAAGLFGEDDRLELLGGDLVMMSPIGSQHAGQVNWLTRVLVQNTIGRAIVAVQNPVKLDDNSEPLPDLAVLHPREDDYRRSTPTRPMCCC